MWIDSSPDSAAYFFKFFANECDESGPPDFPDLSCLVQIDRPLFSTSVLLHHSRYSKRASLTRTLPISLQTKSQPFTLHRARNRSSFNSRSFPFSPMTSFLRRPVMTKNSNMA